MKKKVWLGLTTAVVSISLIVGSSITIFAGATSYAKWSSRTQTLFVATSGTDTTAWNSGATKWRNNTNFKVSTLSGTSLTYYASDVYVSGVDWDGEIDVTVSNGTITKALTRLNKYHTNNTSLYTNSIKAAVAAHEIGHSLGLNDTSVVEISSNSIMYPYTFNDDHVLLRPLNPTTSDKNLVNAMYPSYGARSSADFTADFAKQGDGVYLFHSWSVYYDDEESLTTAADLVVKGTVSAKHGTTYQQGDYKTYYTNSSVQINEVLKGNEVNKGQTIVVSQMGGSDGKVNVFVDHSTHLQENQEVMLFLRKKDDGTYSPINSDDGVYVKEDKIFNNIATHKALQ